MLLMSGVREKKRQDVVLRPGITIPALGYLASLGFAIAMVIVVATPSAPNHSLGARWGFGQVLAVFVWAFYKYGSQRIILSSDVMRVVSLIQSWNVRRGGVQEVASAPEYAVVIVLTDGSLIEPLMFLTEGGFAGLSRNALSRMTIPGQIMEWNDGALPGIASDVAPLAWRQLRLNLLPLLALSTAVAVGSISLTLANVW
jgi:hypothetical protein